MNAADFSQGLAGFVNGTNTWYRHWIDRRFFYTDGIKFLADNGAAWLLDAIFSHIKTNAIVQKEEFQVWRLKENPDKTATLVGDDGDGRILAQQRIPYTDFPLPEIKIYVEVGYADAESGGFIMMLPRER